MNRYKDIIKFIYKKIWYINRSKMGIGYFDKFIGKWIEFFLFGEYLLYYFY